jgi:hypothetical protein
LWRSNRVIVFAIGNLSLRFDSRFLSCFFNVLLLLYSKKEDRDLLLFD